VATTAKSSASMKVRALVSGIDLISDTPASLQPLQGRGLS
jgi:hypothetical protein